MADRTGSGGPYVVGIDFGTLSGRAVVVRVADGEQLGSAVSTYAGGVIVEHLPGSDRRLPADWALQDPDDYRTVLREAVPAALRDAGVDPAEVIGVGTDFTSCTMVPTLSDGTPLCEVDGLRDRPHAWVKLWRHHAAQPQADRITALAQERKEPWINRYGGRISSEWQYAKALQVLEEDPDTYRRMERWIEAADWIVWQLCGRETRNRCTAGYKGLYQDGRYPDEDYLSALNPEFGDVVATRIDHPLADLGSEAGRLTAEAAGWTGLPEGIVVAVGNVDAHVTAPAAQAVDDGRLVLVMGTSTCHVMNSSRLAEVPGMCGVVDGGITTGHFGYESGQSGVGDIFAWWTGLGLPDSYRQAAEAAGQSAHEYLTSLTADQPVGAHGLVALDWMSGNRSVLVDHELSGVVVGLTLATRPEDVYLALLESTAFGTRVIVESYRAAGVAVEELVAAGGLVANRRLMQIYADAIGMPLSVIGADQGAALGSAIHAAVAAGSYPDVPAASAAMGSRIPAAYRPDPERQAAYDELFAEYRQLHDYFGRTDQAGSNDVLHRLGRIRRRAGRDD